eukprot:252071_1
MTIFATSSSGADNYSFSFDALCLLLNNSDCNMDTITITASHKYENFRKWIKNSWLFDVWNQSKSNLKSQFNSSNMKISFSSSKQSVWPFRKQDSITIYVSELNKNKKRVITQEETKQNDVDKYLQQLNQQSQKTISLLFLGPANSGKSTIVKQLQKIYGSLSTKLLKQSSDYIKRNILKNIHDLAKKNQILQVDVAECKLNKQSQEICVTIASLDLDTATLTTQLAKNIDILWNDSGLQQTFTIYKKSHAMDNAEYFFEHMHRIVEPNYEVTFEDYVRVKHTTTGIDESQFDVDVDNNKQNGWRFKVTDVGGQRNQRKKWLRCFTDIHSIIYVMSLCSYDQNLCEDNTQNCYDEALNVFDKTMRHEALQTINVVVFFNKNDLFVKKIKEVPFTVFDPNFNKEYANNPEEVKTYLRQEYKKRFYNGIKADKSHRRIHFHVTCATDTKQIKTVMHLIQFETVRKQMRVGMLM